jgi:hypothetical protein
MMDEKRDMPNFDAWNVQGISYKEDQLDDILAKKNVEIAAISDTKKKSQF